MQVLRSSVTSELQRFLVTSLVLPSTLVGVSLWKFAGVEPDTKVVESFVVKTERAFVAPACRSADCMGRVRSTGSKQSKTKPSAKVRNWTSSSAGGRKRSKPVQCCC